MDAETVLYEVRKDKVKAISEVARLKNPPGSESAACDQGLVKEPRRPSRELKGNAVIVQDIKIKTTRCSPQGVRSFHSSKEVG